MRHGLRFFRNRHSPISIVRGFRRIACTTRQDSFELEMPSPTESQSLDWSFCEAKMKMVRDALDLTPTLSWISYLSTYPMYKNVNTNRGSGNKYIFLTWFPNAKAPLSQQSWYECPKRREQRETWNHSLPFSLFLSPPSNFLPRKVRERVCVWREREWMRESQWRKREGEFVREYARGTRRLRVQMS